MSETDGPKLIYLGSFPEGLPTHVILPAAAIRKVEATLDAERRLREIEVERAKLRVRQQATARARLRRAIAACFHRGRKGR
jgi:hypothetical protein